MGSPAVVTLGGDVVLVVVVSSVVIPCGEVTIFIVVTLTVVGMVVFACSFVVETSGNTQTGKHCLKTFFFLDKTHKLWTRKSRVSCSFKHKQET